VFFDCAGVRLFLEKSRSHPFVPNGSVLYFCTPITVAVRELEAKVVAFIGKPHLIAPMEEHDLWLTLFKDPAGNTLALMREAPKSYKPSNS
jgi:predicted enzyme related to lactoylglutathione lyase